ncbi:uncharacterized protein LOC115874395 [Sitophilus oryzae]|uniref:Uncharacterized protein LOC115874395 n=1 Tax=Sitophilus oryzae TaxID=7048 RepID=A0A6J2X343_SITOR|nr:uncharacterized protein LOC115874395 [Sitophilus oryzae]
MPKRKISTDKKNEMKKLNKKLKKIQEKLDRLESSDSSSSTSSSEISDSHSEVEQINSEEIPNSLQDADQAEINFDFFGIKPVDRAQVGAAMHNEIAVRWSAVLQSGLGSAQRNEIIGKYKIPENCLELLPPKTNEEIQPCLPESVAKHDNFITALQLQLGHGLAAIATVITKNLTVAEQANDNQILGEACQIIANVHNALSIHRKFKIVPHLHPDCARVAKGIKMDEHLFGKYFHEVFKTNQALRKSSLQLKKRAIPTPIAGPSGTQQKQRQSLNYQHPQYKRKFKERRREEKPKMDRNIRSLHKDQKRYRRN